MNSYCFLLIIVILFNYFIDVVYSENAHYIVSILRKESDITFDDESQEVQLQIEKLVNDRMNDIYDVIEDNKESYTLENGEQDQKLEELETNPLRKRGDKPTQYLFINPRKKNNHLKRSIELSNSNYFNSTDSNIEYIPIKSKLVNHICPIKNYYAINVYLSDETAEIVCHLPNVINCEKSTTYQLHNSDHQMKKNFDYEIIKQKINSTDIVEQQINLYYNHLALISTGDYTGKEDENIFRYPVSAGKGIDIYIIDIGFSAHHDDFDTYEGTEDERTITCDAIIDSDELRLTDERTKYFCYGKLNKKTSRYDDPDHGVAVSSVAADTIYGVAKKANIHNIAADLSIISVLRAFDYILLNAKPHKTVINLSFGGITFYHKSDDDKLSELIHKGFIIFTSAGNENENCCAPPESENFNAFGGYRKAITVGSAFPNIGKEGYTRESFSNYGDCVDIYAPGGVTAALFSYDSWSLKYPFEGTSFSSPIAAGVAASIMSENPDYEFDNESMKNVLIDLSIKGSIRDLKPQTSNTPNRFLNNGKNRLLNPLEVEIIECGIESPNHSKCTNGCCSKEGKCLSFNDNPGEKCLIENGCQSDYGFCTTKEEAITECEKEIEKNKECQVELSKELNDEDLLNCITIKNTKCSKFYESLNHPHKDNQYEYNICGIARNFKDFGFINTMDIPKYNKYLDICYEEIYYKYQDECQKELSNHRKCLIDDNILSIINLDIKDIKDLGDNLIDGFQKICINFKSDFCVDFRSHPNEIIHSFHTCNLLDKLSVIDVYEREILLSKTNYDTFTDFCERIFEFKGSTCYSRIEEYDECLPLFTENITNEELINNCSLIKSKKCQNFYEDKYLSIPVCNTYLPDYEKSELLMNLEETLNTYITICDRIGNDGNDDGSNDEIKTKIISDCKMILQNNECLFDYRPEMEDEEITPYCKIFRSEKCKEKYTPSFESIGVCKLAHAYNDTEIETLIQEYEEKYIINDFLCQISQYDVIQLCEFSLGFKNYEGCLLDEENSPEDIYYNCLVFKEDFCQKFYDNPYKDIPECIVAGRYKDYNIFGKKDKKWKYYNEICPSIIEAGIKPLLEPTQTSLLINDEPIETDITDININTLPNIPNIEPTITNSNSYSMVTPTTTATTPCIEIFTVTEKETITVTVDENSLTEIIPSNTDCIITTTITEKVTTTVTIY
ncbi:hypothetical protein BCR32DRAFT_328040 [Anaeromyces robustus]|uniref:Peptidase S8/S53 domain-containing protein n=1 Tax=Anaeromyces robustus TaxID=1754192 RepID=A0A1Y1X1I1_9FUNG|nr:hypothetical protein BCR32DRAFT_328040 [Anaeromyces robustus]|eukprot:ORX79667.1 hypothetical protein BCR32DRAFT_328040 [Anaeromyces robustus]